MNPFRSHSFTVESRATADELASRLEPHVKPKKWFQSSCDPKDRAPFEGTLTAQGFELSRVVNCRNSFLPVITGRFEQKAEGTHIHVTMALHPLVMVFLCCWLGFAGLITLCALFGVAFSGLEFWVPLIPVGMIVAAFGLAQAGFTAGVDPSQRKLMEILTDPPA